MFSPHAVRERYGSYDYWLKDSASHISTSSPLSSRRYSSSSAWSSSTLVSSPIASTYKSLRSPAPSTRSRASTPKRPASRASSEPGKSASRSSARRPAAESSRSGALQTLSENRVLELSDQLRSTRTALHNREASEKKQSVQLERANVDLERMRSRNVELLQELKEANERLSLVHAVQEGQEADKDSELARLRADNHLLLGQYQNVQTEFASLKLAHDVLQDAYRSLRHKHEILQREYTTREAEIQAERRKTQGLRSLDGWEDKTSPEDVITHLKGLNESFRNLSDLMLSQFRLSSDSALSPAGVEEAIQRAAEILGPRMVQLIAKGSRDRHPAAEAGVLVGMAFRAGFCAYGEWMISSWMFNHPKKEDPFVSVYESLRQTESSRILGIWRSLARKSGQRASRVSTSDLNVYYLDAIVNILIVSGLQATLLGLHDHLKANYSSQFNDLVDQALQLNRAVGEDITSHDLEVVHIPPDTLFDPKLMEDVFGRNVEEPEPVLCTVELGLWKLVRDEADSKWENRMLVKPRVLLLSSLDNRGIGLPHAS